MQPFRLCKGIGFCRFDDCAIVLDLQADRYWQLGPASGSALAWVAGAIASVTHPSQLEYLSTLNMIEPDEGEVRTFPPRLPDVAASAIETADRKARFSASDAWQVASATIAARRAVRSRRLASLVDLIRRRRARHAGRPARADLPGLALRFQRYRRWVPVANLCLPDSLAFLAFANRHGHFPYLVFGVVAYPFAAHCWVQAQDIVLNDVVDHAAIFQPILVV